MDFAIRRTTGRDSAEVVRVIRAVFDEYGFEWEADTYHADLYNLEANYDALGDRFYVAESAGAVVGTAALEFFDRVEGGGPISEQKGMVRVTGADCSLERMYVHPDARRGGLGKALLEHVVAEAREAGRTTMEFWSDKRFHDAHRLYQRFGAVVVGERLCDDIEQSPEWGLKLDLSSQ